MAKLNEKQLKDFLIDIERYSETFLLEEGKEKNDLINSAKKRGIILLANSMDLGVIKTKYAFTNRVNNNGAILPENEFVKVFPQIVGRPMNFDHQRQMIIGFYIDYKYIAKTKTAIAYAIFFKSVFPKLWKKAINLQKKGKLSSSFEIWSPFKQRKYLPNGTYELHNMQMAGGALIFEENGNEPAFKDAKVLSLAKDLSNTISEECLVYASKYNDNEIITAETEVPTVSKILCGNCKREFIPVSLDNLKLNCPHCKAIVDKSGSVIYPPQIKDYHIQCPICKGDFTILESSKDTQKVQCNGCGEKFILEFYSSAKPDALQLINFLYEVEVSCPQCGNVQCINTLYGKKEYNIKCDKCGVVYPFNLKLTKKRKIKRIISTKKEEKRDNQMVKAKLNVYLPITLNTKDIKRFLKEDFTDIEVSARLKYNQRKKLPDSSFAVVLTVKNKITGKPRKIRKYPINDKAHVRNALARLAQVSAKEELRKLGISVESVKRKILKRAKELNMTELLKKYKSINLSMENINRNGQGKGNQRIGDGGTDICICPKCGYIKDHKKGIPCINSKCPKCGVALIGKKEIANYSKLEKRFKSVLLIAKELKGTIKELKSDNILKTQELTYASTVIDKLSEDIFNKDEEIQEIKNETDFYKENAKKILSRRESLGDLAKDMTDEQLLDEKDYEIAMLKKQNMENKPETATDNVGDIPEISSSDSYYKKIQEDINEIAFGKKE